MKKSSFIHDKNVETIVRDILKSKAFSNIYLYLIRKNGAVTEQIIRGSHLHPSTVRETLSKMNEQKLIFREKIKNDKIGKNPFVYYAISPFELIKRYSKELEENLNRLARLAVSKGKGRNYKPVKIKIKQREEST